MKYLLNIFSRMYWVLLSLPFVFVSLEIAIRIAAPQPIEDLPYEQIFTQRFSPSLNRKVKSLVPGITRTYNGATVHINSYGNRDHEYLKTKRENSYRIAIVGSSVAFGYKLGLEDTFAKILEKDLNRLNDETSYEVLLFGRPGFEAKEVYACIMDEVFGYNPDLIIYSFVQNNYEDISPVEFFGSDNRIHTNETELNDKVSSTMLSVLRDHFWQIKQLKMVRLIRYHSHLYLFAVNSVARLLRELSPAEKEKAQSIESLFPNKPQFVRKIVNTEAWISLMAEECKRRDIKFSLLMLPYEMQLTEAGSEKWNARGLKLPPISTSSNSISRMKSFCDKEGIGFIDLVPAFTAALWKGQQLYLPGDFAHLTKMGNTLVASTLLKMIQTSSPKEKRVTHNLAKGDF